MLSDAHRDVMQTKGVVIGRILLGFMFFFTGVGMLMVGPSESVGFYESVGIPLAGIVVWLVTILKIVAGGSLMMGKCTEKAAAALAAFTLLATLAAHTDLEDPGLVKNLAIVGGFLYVIAFGPGRWKSDSQPGMQDTDSE